MNKEDRIILFNEFMEGMSIQELADNKGVTWSEMYQIIASKLPTSKELTKEEENEIVGLYVGGLSSTKIGEQFKISHKLVGKILDEYGVHKRNTGGRVYTLDEHYFDKINSQNKAYILGLLYADGYNTINKGTIRLQLSVDDEEILNKINAEVGSNRPLKLVDCSKRVYGNGYTSKNMYDLELFSVHMCKTLDAAGMHQNKSLILDYPSFLPDDLNKHFIRGYFDGDGSIYQFIKKSGYPQTTLTITSTENFCNKCLQIIRDKTSIGGNIYDASCHNGVTKVITVCGNNQCKKITDWLYEDAEMFIQRKYDRYINYFYSDAA